MKWYLGFFLKRMNEREKSPRTHISFIWLKQKQINSMKCLFVWLQFCVMVFKAHHWTAFRFGCNRNTSIYFVFKYKEDALYNAPLSMHSHSMIFYTFFCMSSQLSRSYSFELFAQWNSSVTPNQDYYNICRPTSNILKSIFH